MNKNNWIIPSLVIGGLLLVAASIFLSKRTDTSLFGQKPVARIEQGMGQVYVFRKNMTVKEKLNRKALLYSLDSVESTADGDAVLEFDSAYRIRILENTLITVEQEKGIANIVLKQGDLQVENYGQEGTVYISKDGTRWSATDFEMVYKKQNPESNLPDSVASTTTAAHTETADNRVSNGLSADYIQDLLKSQRNSFFKCYTQLLQKTPGLVGQVSLSFTIERSGKVIHPEVATSTFSDNSFKKCLIEALQRIEFKSFTGDPITTLFPIKFE